AHDDGDVLVRRGRGDDDLLGAAFEVAAGLLRRGEDAGGLDDDVDAVIAPRDRGRALLDRECADRGVADGERGVVEGDVLAQAAEGRVVLQEVSEHVVRGQVVDGHDLDVRLAPGLQRLHRTVEVAADPSESVDAYAHGHVKSPWRWCGVSAGTAVPGCVAQTTRHTGPEVAGRGR